MAKPYQESRLVGAGLTIIQNNPADVNKASLLNMLPPPFGPGRERLVFLGFSKGARGRVGQSRRAHLSEVQGYGMQKDK